MKPHGEMVALDTREFNKKNILIGFENFNNKMSVSKVVKYFERHNIHFTKTMLQNYVRVGVLPPLFEKRYYTKKHFVLLFFIDCLKNIYSLDELTVLFEPIFDLENESDYDSILEFFISSYNEGIKTESDNIINKINEVSKIKPLHDDKEYFGLLASFAKSGALIDINKNCLD